MSCLHWTSSAPCSMPELPPQRAARKSCGWARALRKRPSFRASKTGPSGEGGLHSVLVANPKGGSGKTTVVTNLASGLASRGEPVYLWDLDRQQSSLTWLGMRPPYVPAIDRLDQRDADEGKAEKGRWLVIDTPAGLHGKALSQSLKLADKILVPVQPSV